MRTYTQKHTNVRVCASTQNVWAPYNDSSWPRHGLLVHACMLTCASTSAEAVKQKRHGETLCICTEANTWVHKRAIHMFIKHWRVRTYSLFDSCTVVSMHHANETLTCDSTSKRRHMHTTALWRKITSTYHDALSKARRKRRNTSLCVSLSMYH